MSGVSGVPSPTIVVADNRPRGKRPASRPAEEAVPEPQAVPLPFPIVPINFCDPFFLESNFASDLESRGIKGNYRIADTRNDPRFKELSPSAYLSLLLFELENPKNKDGLIAVAYNGCAYMLIRGDQINNEKVLKALLPRMVGEKREPLPIEDIPAPQTAVAAPVGPERKKSVLPWVLWPAFWGGAAVAAGGIAFQLNGNSANQSAGSADSFSDSQRYLADARGNYDRAKALYIAGGAAAGAAAAGLVWYYFFRSDPQDSVSVNVAPNGVMLNIPIDTAE